MLFFFLLKKINYLYPELFIPPQILIRTTLFHLQYWIFGRAIIFSLSTWIPGIYNEGGATPNASYNSFYFVVTSPNRRPCPGDSNNSIVSTQFGNEGCNLLFIRIPTYGIITFCNWMIKERVKHSWKKEYIIKNVRAEKEGFFCNL